ncbi:MAG: hypothetical protein WEA09_14940 [Gemmatimonadota bacterium]
MSYFTYKVIHYLGIFILVTSLGAALGQLAVEREGLRRRWWVAHGVGLFLVLLGGFGLLARIGVEHGELFPGWVWLKLAIWVTMGGILWVARRKRSWSMALLALVPLLAALAGYTGLMKPF